MTTYKECIEAIENCKRTMRIAKIVAKHGVSPDAAAKMVDTGINPSLFGL